MPFASSRSSAVACSACPSASATTASLTVAFTERVACELEREHGLHEPLLCAVVEVALDLPPRRVGGGHDASARGDELRALVRVRDRAGHESRELPQAGLCVR